MRIIHVVLGKANPDRMNGVNKVVNSLAKTQAELGHQVWVWGLTKTPYDPSPQRPYLTRFFKDKFKFKLDQSIEKEIETLPKDTVFHIHGGFIPQFYLISRILVKHSLAYTYTPHGAYNLIALKRSALKKKIYIRFLERYIVRHSRQLHFIGKSEVMGSEHIFGNQPYSLIPNGQETIEEEIERVSRSEKTLPIFGFVGRLDITTKGLDLLLSGFSLFLRQERGSAELWIIGDGPEKAVLERMARDLHIAEHVKFLGSKYGEDKQKLMASMDCFCLTSRNEEGYK